MPADARPFISASRRTDIPAWYTPWFMNRVRAGWCRSSNPFRPSQTYRISLDPASVNAIFFWTRWPAPMLPFLGELSGLGHRFVFHVTLTGLPAPLEPGRWSLDERIAAIQALSRLVGRERVWWRYDPIILGELLPPSFHLETFARLSAELAESTSRVTMSLVDWYRKTARRTAAVEGETGALYRLSGDEPEVQDLAAGLAGLARSRGIAPVSCCEPGFAAAGVPSGACIDGTAVNRIFGTETPSGRDPGQRPHCRCAPSYDIGAASTCPGGCIYCYSTISQTAALANHARHNPNSEFLIDPPEQGLTS